MTSASKGNATALGVRYLRRKPGKGIFILYGAGSARQLQDGELLCLTFAEAAGDSIDGNTVPDLLRRLELAAGDGAATTVTAPGITIRRLPDDPGLPALRAAWTPTPGDDLCRVLEPMLASGRAPRPRVIAATAVPRHYKPGSRCVIEYRLIVGGGAGGEAEERTVYGKLFAKPDKAYEGDRALRRLMVTWDAGGPFSAWTPRPLGVAGALGMSVTDGAGDGAHAALSGLSVLRPPKVASAATVAAAGVATQLTLAAGALARLHGSSISGEGLPLRTGAEESERALQRGRLIAASLPGCASQVAAVAEQAAAALLERAPPTAVRPSHGSYKRSQLLYFNDGRIAVFDWDSLCVADPAIDLGCFLAHLRPAALWYERPGLRAWVEDAAARWMNAYRAAMSVRGVPPGVVEGIIRRSQAYEAAMLLKMATRRLRRLNSARPGELLAVLAEAEWCLTVGRDASAAG